MGAAIFIHDFFRAAAKKNEKLTTSLRRARTAAELAIAHWPTAASRDADGRPLFFKLSASFGATKARFEKIGKIA